MEKIRRLGVHDTGGYYLLITADGSEIHFSENGVDGSRFAGWPDYNFDEYRQRLDYECGAVNFNASQGNHTVTIPLGQVCWSDRLRLWMHAVNARLPHR